MNIKRHARRGIETGVPVLGVLIILGSVLFVPDVNQQLHVTILLTGVLVLQAGPSGLTHLLLPSERTAPALRAEGDQFIQFMRVLNHPALASEVGKDDDEVRRDTIEEMHASVERMAKLVG